MNDHIPDVTKMINDTPRMQSALLDHPDAGFAKIWQVGCEIERELNAANEMFRKLNIHALNLADRIKRLEEAGDELMYDNDDMANINRWHKAKEAKP